MAHELVSGSLFLCCLRTFTRRGKLPSGLIILMKGQREGYTEVTSRKTPRTLPVARRGNGITLITW